MTLSPEVKTFQDYHDFAQKTDRKKSDAHFVWLGLFGEAGSVLSAVKKLKRDKAIDNQHKNVIIEELGDTFWYLSAVADRNDQTLGTIAKSFAKRKRIKLNGDSELLVTAFDKNQTIILSPETSQYQQKLESLASEIGYAIYRHRNTTLDLKGLKRRLETIFQILIEIAQISEISVQEILQGNIDKIYGRYVQKGYDDFSDDFEPAELPDFEKLPEQISIKIFEIEKSGSAGKGVVIQRYNDKINIGDRLTDNIEFEDFYRFHDVFHYAYAAVLHWSPVTRALLKLKRKSLPSKDENEDGARAILIEEGVATFIFNFAKDYKYFEGINEGELNSDVLNTVARLVRGFEVEQCPIWLWERAILQGFTVFRSLINSKSKSGEVTLDMHNRSLSYRPLK